MRERPKVGDRVEFYSRGRRVGRVVGLAETGYHFLIEMPFPLARDGKAWRRIPLSAIIRILPGE